MIKLRAVLEMFTKGTGKAKEEVSGINDELLKSEKTAKRINKTFSETQVGKGAMSRAGVGDPGNTRDYRTQRGVTGARGASGRNFAAMAQGGDGQGLVAAYATLAANIFTLTAGFQALSNAAKTQQLAEGLDLVGARAGVALGITAKGLVEVTGYGISAAESMRAVAQATAAGFKGKEIEELGKIAKGASVALGRDLSDAMDRLIKGTIKLEPELLDELGIMTRLDNAVKTYAEANNKAVSSLTQTERRQAFLNAVLEEGARKFGDISDQIDVNPYDKLAGAMKDLGTTILSFINKVFIPLAKLITEVPVLGIALALAPLSQALSKVTPSLDSFYKKVEGNRAKLAARQDFVAGLIPDVQQSFIGAKDGSEEQLQAKKELIRLQKQDLNLQTRINAQVQQTRIIENFRETIRRQGIFSAIKELGIAQKNLLSVKTAMSEEAVQERKKAINAQFETTRRAKGYWWANKERRAAEATLAADRQRMAVQAGITTMTKIRVGLTAIGGAASFIMASLGSVLTALTLIATAVALAVAAFKFLFPPTELQKRLKEASEKMKELAEQASKTGDQIQRMLEPGKQQQGLAFDAIVTSIQAANAELESFARIQKEIEESKGISITVETTSKGEIVGERVLTGQEAVRQIDKEFNNRFRDAGFTNSSQRKLLLENYKLLLANLDPLERANKLRSVTPAQLAAEFKGVSQIKIAFKDLEETSKNISKFTKDLVPEEPKNAMRDLSKEFNDIYNFSVEASKIENPLLNDLALRGAADAAAQLQPELKDILTILKSQGVAIQGSVQYMADLNNITEKQKFLAQAIKDGQPEVIAAAEEALKGAQDQYNENKNINDEVTKQFATALKILAVKKDILTKTSDLLKSNEKLAGLEGANAKSALEYNKAIQDAARVATGADITLPEEFSYAYKKSIADLELRNAETIAGIRKQSAQIELALALIEIDNQRALLLDETELFNLANAHSKNKISVVNADGELKSYQEIQSILRTIKDEELQNAIISQYKLKLLDRNKVVLAQIATQQEISFDYETKKAEVAVGSIDAQIEASLKQESINIKNLKNLDQLLKAKNEVTKADKEILDNLVGQSQIYGNIASIFKLETLPALNIQRDILKNQIKLQEDLVAQEQDAGRKAEAQRLLDLLLLQEGTVANQTKAVYQQANAYLIANGIQEMGVITKEESLLVDQIALQNSEKALANLKEELSLAQKLRDVQLTTARQIAQAEATKRGGEVAPQLERDFARTEASNILKNLEDEKKSLVKEKELVVKKMELEKLVMEIRLAAAKQELKNAIALAPPGTDVSESKNALDKITKVEGLLGTVFDKEKGIIDKQFADRTLILDTQIQGQKAVLDALPKSAREVADRLIEGLKGGLGAALGGIGLTGAAADFYARESQGIINSGMSKEDQENALANIRSMSGELQGQQILTEGLAGIYGNLASGIEGAFMAMIDGSKSAKEAFGEMAAAIIKDIAAMIIKMLVFKAIEMGLNMLLPGSGTAVSAVASHATPGSNVRPSAAGGIIAMATGGVIDRAMGVQSVIKQPTYLVGEGRYNEAVVPLPNGRAIPVQMHGGGQSNNVAVNVNISNSGQVQTETQGQDMGNLGQAIAVAVQKELIAQKMPGGILNRYGAA